MIQNVPQDYTDVLFRRWVVYFFCHNVKECWVCKVTKKTLKLFHTLNFDLLTQKQPCILD